jgi:hypothetical protein
MTLQLVHKQNGQPVRIGDLVAHDASWPRVQFFQKGKLILRRGTWRREVEKVEDAGLEWIGGFTVGQRAAIRMFFDIDKIDPLQTSFAGICRNIAKYNEFRNVSLFAVANNAVSGAMQRLAEDIDRDTITMEK